MRKRKDAAGLRAGEGQPLGLRVGDKVVKALAFVFRHRAPLFIAEVDPERLRVIRSTEKIAVPERGARLGNFGCCRISDRESWIVASEWMQSPGPLGPENLQRCLDHGSDNSIFIARILF